MRIALTAAASAALLAAASGLRAGCLAPADAPIAASATAGPLWGHDDGSLLHLGTDAQNHSALYVRAPDGTFDLVGAVGDANEFRVGGSVERWAGFAGGTINAQSDVAFAATTTVDDDPLTPENESAPRRGVYARRGHLLFEVARFGGPSPILDVSSTPVPWATLFDAAVADRDAGDALHVAFSGQLGGADDHRFGIFAWQDGAATTPIVLTGDAAPTGGTFTSIGRLRTNGRGDVAFFGATRASDTSPQASALYVVPDAFSEGAAAVPVVRFGAPGDAAPGGGNFAVAGDFDVDDAGVVVFAATLSGGSKKSGLFRARPPGFVPELIASEGDASPIGGRYGSFSTATVRTSAAGEIVFGVPLTGEIEADGVFVIPAGTSEALALASTENVVAVAAMGEGRAAYQTPSQVRIVRPSDGSEEGPTDFRIVALDVRNAAPLRADTIRFEGRFRLPPWNVAGPATFRGDLPRFAPDRKLEGAGLAKIAEVKVVLSSGPGNEFDFSLEGSDASPVGRYRFNGNPGTVKRLVLSKDGSAATWTFLGSPGPGRFTIDFAAGTFKLSVSKASIFPSFEAPNFRVALFLRTAQDVAQSVPDADSFFARDLRIAGRQVPFGTGRRVTSSGEGTAGGTLFVDAVRVSRRYQGTSAVSDTVRLDGTLRQCPGTTTPSTPTIHATLTLGDLHLDDVTLTRVGNRGSSYRLRGTSPPVDLRVDLVKGTFSLRVSGIAPLTQLADPQPASATNDVKLAVGGMTLPFSLSIPRVYESSYDLAITRLPGGKLFVR